MASADSPPPAEAWNRTCGSPACPFTMRMAGPQIASHFALASTAFGSGPTTVTPGQTALISARVWRSSGSITAGRSRPSGSSPSGCGLGQRCSGRARSRCRVPALDDLFDGNRSVIRPRAQSLIRHARIPNMVESIKSVIGSPPASIVSELSQKPRQFQFDL